MPAWRWGSWGQRGVADDLRAELRRTVADPSNRQRVLRLIERAREGGWGGGGSLDPFQAVEQDMARLNRGIAGLVASKVGKKRGAKEISRVTASAARVGGPLLL